MNNIKKSISILIIITMILVLCPTMAVFAADIIGCDKIQRAPVGMMARHPYSLSDNYEAIWSIENAPDGVVMAEDGNLFVPGETVLTSNVTATIFAKDNNGNVLAQKDVLFENNINSDKANNDYVDYPKRAYWNFEIYNVGDSPAARFIKNANWDDMPIKGGAKNRSALDPCVIKEDESGNKYASASGSLGWDSTGVTFLSNAKFAKGAYNSVFARLMIENTSKEWSFLFQTDRFDIRYAPISETETGIYLHSWNGQSVSPKKLLTTVTPGEWNEVWIEIDGVKSDASVYINDEQVIMNEPYTGSIETDLLGIGCAVDDVAYFSGFYTKGIPSDIPEKIYLTDSMNCGIVSLDDAMSYAGSRLPGKAEHSIVSGDDARIENGKLYVDRTCTEVEILTKEIKITEEEALAEEYASTDQYILTLSLPYKYDRIEKTRTIAIEDGIEVSSLDASATEETVTLPGAKGAFMLSFLFDGGFSAEITDGVNEETFTFSYPSSSSLVAEEEKSEAQIFVDTFSGKYSLFVDGDKKEGGETNLTQLSDVTFSGSAVEKFVFSNINPTKPYVVEPMISGIHTAGQSVSASFGYYSPWGGEKMWESVEWFCADAASGEYSSIGEGKELILPENLAEKYVKFTATVSDGISESIPIDSSPVIVNPALDLSLAEGNLTITIRNAIGSEKAVTGIMLYENSEVRKTIMQEVTFSSSEENLVITMGSYTGAVVSLFYPETLLPVCASKSVGTVGELTKNVTANTIAINDGTLTFKTSPKTMTTVLVLGNVQSPTDATQAYSLLLSKEEIIEELESNIIENDIAYMYAAETKEDGTLSLTLPNLKGGSYYACVLPRGKSEINHLWMSRPEELFTVTTMNLAGFSDVLKLYSEKKDEEVDKLYALYNALTNKSAVEKLIKGEAYNIEMFDLSVLLTSYLENTDNEDIYKKLIEELKAQKKAETALKLLNLDAKRSETAQLILNDAYTDIDTLLNKIHEKAVLCGIANVKNYMETEPFLASLTDTVYNTSSYKTEMCEFFAKKSYSSLIELKEAINSFTYEDDHKYSGSGGSSGGGSFGGNGEVSVKSENIISVSPAFKDVSNDHWAGEAITYLYDKKIISGTPDGEFQPDKAITRAEFVKIICEAFSLNSNKEQKFTDVTENSWYERYCAIAGALGIVTGDGNFFRPNDNITREDATVIMHRVLTYKNGEIEAGSKTFRDMADVSSYAANAVKTLASMGLISGMGDNFFAPKDTMTKAQCAQIVANCLKGE